MKGGRGIGSSYAVHEGDEQEIVFSGKKKSKKKSNKVPSVAFAEDDSRKNTGEAITAKSDNAGADDGSVDHLKEDEPQPTTMRTNASKNKNKKKDKGGVDYLNECDGQPATTREDISKRKKKKGGHYLEDADDDFGASTIAEDERALDDDPEIAFSGKKKSKKKSGNNAFASILLEDNLSENGDESEMATTGQDDEISDHSKADMKATNKVPLASKNRKKKGGKDLQDDEDLDRILAELSEGPIISTTSSSSFQKGVELQELHELVNGLDGSVGGAFGAISDGTIGSSIAVHEGDAPEIVFSGKKKSKKKNNRVSSVILAEDESRKNIGEEAGTGKPDNAGANDASVDYLEDDALPATTRTYASKKEMKKKKGGHDVEDDEYALGPNAIAEDERGLDDNPEIVFSGKKKSKKKRSNNAFASILLEEDLSVNGDESEIGTAGKNGENRKKKGGKAVRDDDEEEDRDGILGELGEGPTTSDPVSEENVELQDLQQSVDGALTDDDSGHKTLMEVDTEASTKAAEVSRKNNKKKKVGKTAQEDDDLDRILMEFGAGPLLSLSHHENAEPESVKPAGDADENEKEGGLESAAAKKKKKKKEKEKEKKAMAAAALESKEEERVETRHEAKGKGGDKKTSKGGKGLQQLIAKRKEAEERQKREEEERRRKEEEERLRQEELERQAEEARQRKKEREKEKLLKKKLEGKLLTGKQKEEARRLEAMRNQILANACAVSPAEPDGAPPKRPVYKTKKPKPLPNGTVTSHLPETPSSPSPPHTALPTPPESPPPETDEIEIEPDVVEEEQEDEWDAKSWDDDTVLTISTKSAFADEDVDSEPEPVTSAPVDPPPKAAVRSAIPEKQTVAAVVVDGVDDGGHSDLRSPICCIMGHVDTGKTKLLDCIRGTNVQEGEAGGITQQIGATYFPAENIRERTKELKEDAQLKVPGLLVIDTPGHESFTNLRSRGSGLCDIAILVVDIMHGLEPQTLESINLLRMRNTEFIVALNKVDRLYGWKVCRNAPIAKAMKQQSKDVRGEFDRRLADIIFQFKEQGLNTQLYYKNRDHGSTYNVIPTSAISGEGIPDLLLWLVQWTQKTMVEKLTYSDAVQCTVLEVKVIEGHGTTIDVVLVNGVIHEGDQIVVCGMQGPIVATIRALLTPHPMKELRVKGTYVHHKEIKAAQGIKISAQGLEHAVAGTGLYVVGERDDVEAVKESAMEDIRSVMGRIDRSGEGVYVQASTIGSLEALLEFLKSAAVRIPVSGIGIGPIHKKDVMKASVMLEKRKEFATILAFDVKVTPEARELADEQGVRIFCADIIYHLFDQFSAYMEALREEKRREAAEDAVFPCVLRIMPNCVFNKKDPIVLGVDVLEGTVKVGTPICVPQREFVGIGRIASIENNHKPVDTAPKGQKVAVKIVGANADEQQKMFGRHFEIDDMLVSHLTRRSIDVLKENYRTELSKDEWQLVARLKRLLNIM